MRVRWMVNVSVGLLLTVLLAQSGATQQRTTASIGSASPPPSAGNDWPMYRHDLAGTGYSPLTQINTRNVATLSRVWTYRLQADTPAAPAPGGRGGAGGVNSEVTPIVVNRVMYLPAANRVVALEPETGKEIWRYPVDRRRTLEARRGVLAGRWQQSAHHLHRGTPPDRAQRQYRRARPWLRQGRRSGHGGAVQLGAARLQERRGRRREHTAGGQRWNRQSSSLRCAHGRQALGVQLRAAARSGWARHLGRRQLEGPPWRQCLAVLLHARRAARPSLPAAGFADRRRVRRRPKRRQSVRQFGRGGRYPDGHLQVAFPDDPSRSVGRRPARASGLVRHRAK